MEEPHDGIDLGLTDLHLLVAYVFNVLHLNLFVKLDTTASLFLLLELFWFSLEVLGDKVGGKQSYATVIAALPPIGIAIVDDYH
jgi:hypothetical protein